MRMLVIVVVEQSQEGWSAWFRNSPQNVCVAELDILAVLTLVETHGTSDMEAWDMTKLDARSRDGHLEYLLPCADRRRITDRHEQTNHVTPAFDAGPAVL
jgi:hypothetical protein